MKNVFATSFALENLLRDYGYTRSEPRFSINALGTTIHIFSSNNEVLKNKLILEILPPYCYNFPFSRMDRQDEIAANNDFVEHLKKFIISFRMSNFTVCACVFHGGGSGQITDRFESDTQAKPLKYTQEDPNYIVEFLESLQLRQ